MSTLNASPDPQVFKHPKSSSSQGSADFRIEKFELAITLALHAWPALTLAVQNQWGGPDSADKRDWLAGAISNLFAERPDAIDVIDLEELLLQVMLDEFGVALEDESEIEVAARIWKFWIETREGLFEGVDQAWTEWQQRGVGKIKFMAGGEREEESEDEDDSDGMDVEMDEAPALVETREKPAHEVDEDGFTKVVGKKRR